MNLLESMELSHNTLMYTPLVISGLSTKFAIWTLSRLLPLIMTPLPYVLPYDVTGLKGSLSHPKTSEKDIQKIKLTTDFHRKGKNINNSGMNTYTSSSCD